MAGALRGLARSANRAVQGQLPPYAGLQQSRALGDLPYKPNKYLEDWGTAREHIELTYKWDGKTLRTIAMWMVIFPYIAYNITCREFQKSDRLFGREERQFWGFDEEK